MSANSQTDVEQLIDIIDRALTSKDERVINALRSLMMITLLTDTETAGNRIGPLADMLQTVDRLSKRVNELEHEVIRNRNGNPWSWDREDKWRSKSATDYYLDAVTSRKMTRSTGYGAIPPLTAQNIADLTKALNSTSDDKKI